MPVNYSEVKISNLALVEIGESPISSLDESSKKARHLKTLFPMHRDRLLRAHPWAFAKKRVSLALDSEEPIFGYDKQFLLPTDWLKILEINANSRYAREGDKILTDSEQVKLLYIFRNEDVNSWDASFVNLMAKSLSSELAWSLKGSRTLRSDLKAEFQRDFALAAHNSAYDSAPLHDMEFEGEGRIIAARSGGRIKGY
jgi:hypothetical protein